MLNLDYFYVPPLPETLISCLHYMYKDDFDYDILVKKIATDIGLTETIFIVANSQHYSQGAVATSNLKQAIVRIGGDNLLKILATEFYKSTFKDVDIDFFTLRDFNRHSSYVSHLSVSLGEHLHVEDTNDLMIAGLFHDVGLIARSYCQNNLMKNIVQNCKTHQLDFFHAEKLSSSPSHDILGKMVATKWNLTDRVSFLIENHHATEATLPKKIDYSLNKELDILTFADTLAHRMKFGYQDYSRDTKVSQQFLDRLGLTVDIVSKKTNETFKAVTALVL